MSDAPDINRTFGAALIGLVAGSVLYGLTALQTLNYFRTYTNDPRSLKATVFVLWVLDTIHLILTTATIYWYLVLNFNNPSNLDVGYWAINLQTDCNGLIALIVEIFFARRVWILSKNYWLTGVICALAATHFSLGIYFTVESFRLGHLSEYSKLIVVTILGMGSAAVSDMIITVSLVYYLRKSRTGFQSSDSLITTLVVYAINTGLLTSICAWAVTICFCLIPSSLAWLALFWCLGKLYVNSLLASLNSREVLRRMTDEGIVLQDAILRSPRTHPFTSRHFTKSQGSSNNTNTGPFSPISVIVNKVTERSSDFDDFKSAANFNGKAHDLDGDSEV